MHVYIWPSLKSQNGNKIEYMTTGHWAHVESLLMAQDLLTGYTYWILSDLYI